MHKNFQHRTLILTAQFAISYVQGSLRTSASKTDTRSKCTLSVSHPAADTWYR